jgi:alginate O-acetyltransferase complex protein AlgI
MEKLLSEIGHWLPASDFYVSLPFWGYFLGVVVLYRLAPPRPGLKEGLLLACNLCMLLTLPRFTPTMLVVLGAMCVWTYGVGLCLSNPTRLPGAKARKLVATGGILGILLVLAFFKYGFVQNALLRRASSPGVKGEDFIFLIGISYSSFKAMHFVLEAYKKTLEPSGIVRLVNYILFFSSFISGPISRYNDFYAPPRVPRGGGWREDLRVGLGRIVDGLFKKTVLTAVLFPHTINNLGVPLQEAAPWRILVGLYATALYFYFDFSGYTDLAIGSARLMGFPLPENFNYPIFKKNIQQWWANWHMSLTSWLTDYIYWPLVRKMRNGDYLRKHPILLSNIAILVTFLTCGVWHGETLNFVLWGLYHGVGIAAVNTYQNWKRKVRNPRARKYFASAWSYALGVVLTFNFFAFGQALFVVDLNEVGNLFRWLR